MSIRCQRSTHIDSNTAIICTIIFLTRTTKQKNTNKQSQSRVIFCTFNTNTVHDLQQLNATRHTLHKTTHSLTKIRHFTLVVILYGQQLHNLPITRSNGTQRHFIQTHGTHKNSRKKTRKEAGHNMAINSAHQRGSEYEVADSWMM